MQKNNETEAYLKKTTKGIATIFFGLVISNLLGYLTRVAIVRLYGIGDYGLFSLGNAIVGIAIIISLLGMNQVLVRFISIYIGKKSTERIKPVTATSIKLTIPLSIVLSLVIILFSKEISFVLFNEPSLYPIMWTFALLIPLSVVFSNLTAILRGFQLMKYKVYTEDIIKSSITISLVVTLSLSTLGIVGAVYAYIIGFVFAIVLAIFFIRKSVPDLFTNILKTPLSKEIVFFSVPLVLASYIKLILSWTDTVMLGFLKTSYDVGLYNTALPTAGLLMAFLFSFRYVFMPVMSELYGKKDREGLSSLYNSMSKWIFSITLPLFLLMLLFPDNILSILFGQEAANASIPFAILSAGYFIFTVTGLSQPMIIVIGKTKLNMIMLSISSIANLALNILLIPMFGITGAALATSSSLLLLSSLGTLFCYRHTGLHPIKNYFRPLISAIASLILIYLPLKLSGLVSLYSLLLAFPAFLILYAFFVLLTKTLDRSDLIILKSIEKKTGIKSEFLRKLIRRFL